MVHGEAEPRAAVEEGWLIIINIADIILPLVEMTPMP